MDSHARTVALYPDHLIETLIADLGRRNLQNYQDHETRWLSERSSALRAERRSRKTANKWTIAKP